MKPDLGKIKDRVQAENGTGQTPTQEQGQEMSNPGSRSEGLKPPAGALAKQRLRITFSSRIAYSFEALAIAWLISGTIFCIIVKGPGTVWFWCIWGSAFFVLGWLFVGLPLVALGEQARRFPLVLLILAGGLGGALVMALPTIIFGFYLPPQTHWKHSFDDLKWIGIAFIISALTTALYYRLLNHEAANKR